MRILPVFLVFCMFLASVYADPVLTDGLADDEAEGRQSFNIFDFFGGLNPFATVVSGAESQGLSCNLYTGQKTFTRTYDRDTVVNVGGACGENARITLFSCRFNDCSDLRFEATGYKIDGVSPKFTGWAEDTLYAYKCFSCDLGGNNPDPALEPVCFPDGERLCKAALITGQGDLFCDLQDIVKCPNGCSSGRCEDNIEAPLMEGYCLESDGNQFQCNFKDERECDIDNEFYTSKAQCSAERNRANSDGNIYGVTCSGQVCTCNLKIPGEFSDLDECNAEADRQEDILNGEIIAPAPTPDLPDLPSASSLFSNPFVIVGIVIGLLFVLGLIVGGGILVFRK